MDIRSSLDGLKTLLGVTPGASAAAQRARSGQAAESNAVSSDHATLSTAGSEVALTASEGGVRLDKVTAIQSALESGTYSVPSSAVASKLVDSMLGQGK